ncbi:MAG: ankyrin repeat domain-containing protein, partial [Cyanobacteria bacterium J06607_10]
EADAVDIAQQLLKILLYLQSLKTPVIHRDIKPNNIIRSESGVISLVDFGSVGHTYQNTFMRGSTVVGTFGYMAPEQFRGKVLPASDLYSVGATLLFLLTRRSPAELPVNQLAIDFRGKVNLSDGFTHWLEKLLEPELEARFQSAELAIKGLQRRSSHRWTLAFPQKHSLPLLATVCALFLVTIGIVKTRPYTVATWVGRRYIERSLERGNVNIHHFLSRGGSQSVHSPWAPSLFASAVLQQEYPIALTMLEEGLDLSRTTATGETPLHVIVDAGNAEALTFLLEQRPDLDLDMKNTRGMPPVQVARHESVAVGLLDRGADIDIRDDEGVSLLQHAVTQGWTDVVERYLHELSQGSVSGHPLSPQGESMVAIAYQNRKYSVAQQLIDSGFKFISTDFSRLTFSDIQETILSDLLPAMTNPAALDSTGHGLIHIATLHGKQELVEALLSRGVSSNQLTRDGKTPVEFTGFHEQRDYSHQMSAILIRFLRSGVTANGPALDKAGVLHRLIYLPKVNLAEEEVFVQQLIAQGVSVNYRDRDGNAPLHYTDHPKISRILIEAGANVNAANNEGATPLHYARSYAMGELLVKNGAQINARDKAGRTALSHFGSDSRQRLTALSRSASR